MSTWFVILVLASAGTLYLSYRRTELVERKADKALRELQDVGESLERLQSSVQGSVDELRRELHTKLAATKG